MASNSEYWKARNDQKLLGILDKADVTTEYIGDQYFKASQYLQKQMVGAFVKYRDNNGLTNKEALQLINNMESYNYNELLKKLKASTSTKEKEKLIKQLESGAYGSRIKRLNEINNQMDQVMAQGYNMENQAITNSLRDAVNEDYTRGVYDTQQFMKGDISASFAKIDPKRVDKIIYSNWSGDYFSNRIWANTQQTAEELKKEMMVGVLTGKSEREMADTIASRFQVETFKARRIVATETAAVVSETDQELYKDLGVKYERFVAVHDDRTSDICADLDGTLVKVGEGVEGVNIPPMHPFCRSFMVPVMDDEVEETMTRRVRDRKTGNNEVIKYKPYETYNQWKTRNMEDVSDSPIPGMQSFTNIDDLQPAQVQQEAEPQKIQEESKETSENIEWLDYLVENSKGKSSLDSDYINFRDILDYDYNIPLKEINNMTDDQVTEKLKSLIKENSYEYDGKTYTKMPNSLYQKLEFKDNYSYSTEENQKLWNYIGKWDDCMSINNYLRFGELPKEEEKIEMVKSTIESINSMISKTTLTDDMVLYRNVDDSYFQKVFNISSNELKDNLVSGKKGIAEINQMLKENNGTEVIEKGFMSTSTDIKSNIFEDRNIQMTILDEKGNHACFAFGSHQAEVILGNDSMYDVLNTEVDENLWNNEGQFKINMLVKMKKAQ